MTVCLLLFLLFSTHAIGNELIFADRTEESGLHRFQHRMGNADKRWIIDAMGSGVAAADYDNDGDDDLYFANARPDARSPDPRYTNKLFQNRNGVFIDVTAESGVGDTGYGTCAVFGDINNDGRLDLFVGNRGANVLYQNNGDGSFTDVTETSGLGHEGYCTAAVMGDVDLDGDLDLFVGNYIAFDIEKHRDWRVNYHGLRVFQGPLAFEAERDLLYLNQGDGTFVERSYQSLVNPSVARAMGAVLFSLDHDRYPDFYVANDSTFNHVLRNSGGVFEDVSLISGGGFSDDGRGSAGMGVAAGDFDNDGYTDIYVTSYEDEPDQLYKNIQGLALEEVSAKMGVFSASFHKVTWGCGFADWDADGRLDLYTANGHLYPQVNQRDSLPNYAQGISIYRRDGSRFQDVSNTALPQRALKVCARGSALLDYDNDGDLDIVVNVIDSQPLLLENQSKQGNRLTVTLKTTSAKMYGVRITATSGQSLWSRVIHGGSGYLSQDSGTVHFGLGNTDRIDALTIHWLHQDPTRIIHPRLNQRLIVSDTCPLNVP